MKYTHPRTESRGSRTSAAILLALFTLVAPLSPLFAGTAQAQGGARRPVGGRAGQPADKGGQSGGGDESKSPKLDAPALPSAITIKATMDDGVGVGQSKRPGDTIKYTVTISNTGSDPATGVKFTNDLTGNANLTFTDGTVQTQPLALNDSYDVLGNVRLDVDDPAEGLLQRGTNDFDPDGTAVRITSADTTSTRGGEVNVDTADGTFTYNPPAGYDGVDTFTYKIKDAGPNGTPGDSDDAEDTGTVTLTVSGMIWFIDNSATACISRAAGCGRLTNPFSTLAAFETANGAGGTSGGDTVDPEAGDNIFIYVGLSDNMPATHYAGPLTLEANQKLIGQGASDTLVTISGVTVPAFSDDLPATNEPNGTNPTPPTITAGGIALATANTLRGFNVSDVGSANTKISGSGFGVLTIGKLAEPDVNLLGTGAAMNLANGSFAAGSALNSVASTGSAVATPGLSLTTIGAGGALIISGGTSISNSGGSGINVNASQAAISFGDTTVTTPVSTGVLLVNNTGAISFGDLDITASSGQQGLSATGNNSVTTTSGTISTTGAPAVNVTNSSINLALTSVSADNDAPAAANGISLTTTVGTFSSTGGTILGGSAAAFLVNAGTVTATYGGNITQATNNANAALVSISNAHDNPLMGTGTITFTGTLSATNGPGLQFNNADGVYNFNGTTTVNGGDAGVDITNGSSGAFTFSANTTVSNSNAGPAFDVTGSPGNPSVTFGGTVSQSNGQRAVRIDGTTGNTISFNTVTSTGTSTGILISNANGGNVSFTTINHGTDPDSAGTRLTSNGVTISKDTGSGNGTFSLGAVSIFTNNATGIQATDIDGSINVSSGRVDSSNGQAVNIDGPGGLTTLGMTLTRVDSEGGATNGITIQDTNGSFTVAGSGGSCTSTANCTGGTISGKTGANGNTVGTGVFANNATSISLTRMQFNDFSNYAIRGTSVTGFTVNNSHFSGANGNDAGADEGTIIFDQLLGTSNFSNNDIRGGHEDNFRVRNNNVTATDIIINANTIRDTSTGVSGNDNLIIESSGTANVTTHITGNTFAATNGDHIQINTLNSATMNVTITGNFYSGGGGVNALLQGITLSGGNAGSTETVRFNVSNNGTALNPLVGSIQGGAININQGNGAGNWQGQVNNNFIGTPGVANSGSDQSACIRVENHSPSGDMTALIDGNTCREWDSGPGINTQVGDTGNVDASLNLTITNNSLTNPGANSQHGIVGNFGANSAGTNAVCADVKNNSPNLGAVPPNGGNAIRLRQRNSSTVRLPGYAGANTDITAVQNFIAGQNNEIPVGSVTATVDVPPGGGFVGGAACAQPIVPSGPALAGMSAEGEAQTEKSAQPLVIPGLMITQPAAQQQPAGQIGVPPAAQPAPVAAPARGQIDTPLAPKSKESDDAQISKAGREASRKDGPAKDGPAKGGVVRPSAGSFEVTIGTLPAGDSVTITFDVTVAATLSPAATTSVSNQGTVSSTTASFSNVVTDDPQTTPPAAGDGNDTTVTPIDKFEPDIDIQSSNANSNQGDSVTFTATLTHGTAPGNPLPTGSVSFVDTQGDMDANNDEVLCANVGLTVGMSSSTAQCATTAVDAGTRTIAAIYSGDGRYDPATDTVTQTVTACTSNPVVTSTADSGAGTLREAVTGACAGSTITFNIASADPDIITLTTAELLIDRNLTIQGTGANLLTVQRSTAMGTPEFRIFNVATGKTATISGLTVSNGRATGGTFPDTHGGGIFNAGTLNLMGSTVSGNTAKGGGGGIYTGVGSTLNVTNSTINGNSNQDAGTGGGGLSSEGTTTITNSTISTNSTGAGGQGGGITSTGTTTITNSTIVDNTITGSGASGGGVRRDSGTVNLRNTIVANNTAPADADLSGTFNSQGNNLIETTGSATIGGDTTGNITGQDPNLGPLQNNGGPTQTHKLLAGSPALDAGNSCVLTVDGCAAGDPAVALTTDQRGTGFTRSADSASDADETDEVDIGAYEERASVENIADTSTPEDTAKEVTFSSADKDLVTVTAESSNDMLVPDANVVVSGSGLATKLTITPAAGVSGTTTITVNVTAGTGPTAETATDTFVLTVGAVADTPSVTPATTFVNTRTSTGLVVTPAAGDQATHFKITNIQNGTLFKDDNATQINDGDFILVGDADGDGTTGLRFQPDANESSPGSTFGFNVQAATCDNDTCLGGATAAASVTVNKFDTTVAITSDAPDPSNAGQIVTVNFTVTGNSPATTEPTGDVVITISGGSETCTGTLGSGANAADTIAEGTCQVTLTAAGNPRTLTATYAGDTVFNGNTDTDDHVVLAVPSASIADASAHEAAGVMTFTVVLSEPASQLTTVNFQTADGTAKDGLEMGEDKDYTFTSGTLNFQTGQRVQTISVPVEPDGLTGEPNETFVVNLTGATNANLTADTQATGTITEAHTPGTILISEVRTSGPDPDDVGPLSGADNDFVELYNNSDSPVTVPAGSWGLFQQGATCANDPVLIATIPATTTVIPARGHYLITGAGYGLGSSAASDQGFDMGQSLAQDRHVALFSTTDLGQLSSATRLDAVGFFKAVDGTDLGLNCDLVREGTPLTGALGSAAEHTFFRNLTSGKPQDTGRSLDDFQLVSTDLSVVGGVQSSLGAPGPENSDSPVQRNDKIKATLIDPLQPFGSSPNSVRKQCSPNQGPEECDPDRSVEGTFSIRRRWTNTTGANVEQLRFRLVNVTTGPTPPAGTADLRAITSSAVMGGVLITDGSTVPVEGTTLEGPTQNRGGGLNATLAAGTVSLMDPLVPNESINLQFLLGVQQGGFYRFFVNVEAGPPPATPLSPAKASAQPAKEGGKATAPGGRQ
jgi:hypothetical protein